MLYDYNNLKIDKINKHKRKYADREAKDRGDSNEVEKISKQNNEITDMSGRLII